MVINHQQDACLVAFVFSEPLSLGNKQSHRVLDGFGAAFVTHLADNLVKVFQEVWRKRHTHADYFCHHVRPLKVGGFSLKAFIETAVSLSIAKVLLHGEKMQSQKELKLTIDKAQKFHGHLGPFLVIGVRMGMIAKKVLSASSDERAVLKASVKVRFIRHSHVS